MNTQKILEGVKAVARTTDSILDIFLGGYARSYSAMRRKISGSTFPVYPDKDNSFEIDKKKASFL